MPRKDISSAAIIKILNDSSVSLAEEGIVFANVVTREEVKDFFGLINSKELRIGVYRPDKEKMIGTLFFINSVYDERLEPSSVVWTLRLCHALNEEDGYLVRNIIEKKAPSIKITIVSSI